MGFYCFLECFNISSEQNNVLHSSDIQELAITTVDTECTFYAMIIYFILSQKHLLSSNYFLLKMQGIIG